MEKKMREIIGRLQEIKILERLYTSETAEFLAVYGRRRIGKTFLISRFFKDKGVYFEVTGSKNASKKEQIMNFHREFMALFKSEEKKAPPKNWSDAFNSLLEEISKISLSQKNNYLFR